MSTKNIKPHAELEDRLRFETLIADLSSKFVNLPAEDVDREILEAQRDICEILRLDLSGLWQWSEEAGGTFMLTHLHSTDEGQHPPEHMSAGENFPWCQKQMLARRTVAFSSLDELPIEAAKDREVSLLFGIKSNLTIPLSVGGEASHWRRGL
jgi:hypothetical protein